jgi:zinc protease
MNPSHLILPLALGLLSLPLHAAVDRSQRPPPDPAPAASFPPYESRELANGLKVFVIEDDRKPTLTLRLIVKSGSAADGEKTGLASFAATLLNRGTQNRDAATFAKQADYLGVRLEALASPDAISVSAGGLLKYTDSLLDLFSDAVLHPAYVAEQFAKEQRKALSMLEAEKQEPERLASKLVNQVVFSSHPYGSHATAQSIQSIQRDDLIQFHQTHFRPNNATLAIVGDVKTSEVLPLIEKAFGGWKPAAVPALSLPQPPALEGVKVHLLDRPGSVQSNIVVAKQAPARNVGPVAELNVLNGTLGGGFSGRLFQNLREKHGWTYGAYSTFDSRKQLGAFQASAETRNEVTHLAIGEILKEMERLTREPIPEAELELQRQYNIGNYLLSLESTSRTAQRVQDMELYGLPNDFYRTYAKRMESVTPASAQELSQRYLQPNHLAVVVVGEARQVREELEKLGPVTVYDTDLKVITP